MKNTTTLPLGGSHNHVYSNRLNACLLDAGIQPAALRTFIFQHIDRPPVKLGLRAAIHYRITVIQMERLMLLLPSS